MIEKCDFFCFDAFYQLAVVEFVALLTDRYGQLRTITDNYGLSWCAAGFHKSLFAEAHKTQCSILSIPKIPSWSLRHSACSLWEQSLNHEILYKKKLSAIFCTQPFCKYAYFDRTNTQPMAKRLGNCFVSRG